MSDLVGNPEDRFSHNEAHIITTKYEIQHETMMMVQLKIDQNIEILRYFFGLILIFVYIIYCGISTWRLDNTEMNTTHCEKMTGGGELRSSALSNRDILKD